MSATDIISQVPKSFRKAQDSGDLLYFPSTIHKVVEHDVEFQVRLCPALQEKPKLPTPHFDGATEPEVVDATKSKPDPFAPPYIPNLFVGELKSEEGGDYAVLLNKYSVIPEHFLMVTKEFQSQTSPLLPPDLLQAYLLLAAAKKAGRPLLAFYNCGDNSGASQPHKHVQFIPIEDGSPPIERLAQSVKLESSDKPFSLTSLPYANHVYRFAPNLSSSSHDVLEQALSQTFLFLIDLVISTIRHSPHYPAGKPSYNVLLTLEHMHLIPRGRELHTLQASGESLSVNSLGFAGMLLVKSEAELDAVKTERISNILRGVGLESVHDIQVAGTSLEAPDGV